MKIYRQTYQRIAVKDYFFALAASDLTIGLLINIFSMNTDTIGVWAGLVWNALNEADLMGTKQLKKVTKLKDKELYAAFGWLAREGKVMFQPSPEDPKELLVSLVSE